MTISTSTSFEFNIGQICLMAFRDAGVVSIYGSLTPEQGSAARDLLQRIHNGLQAKGLFARTVDFANVTLITGQFGYTMPNSVLDVMGTAMFIAPGQPVTASPATESTTEIQVSEIQRDEWQSLSSKSASAQPTQYYAHRTGANVEVRYWPVPSSSESGGTIRHQVHRFRADVRDANATVDYERYWTEYLTLALAAGIAMQNSLLDKYRLLKAASEEKLTACLSYSKERGSQRFSMGHTTGWGNR